MIRAGAPAEFRVAAGVADPPARGANSIEHPGQRTAAGADCIEFIR
jgi:hypothetical protein